MLTRIAKATKEIEHALANYEFANYAQALYRFIWDDFCDWYLEAIKPTVADSAHQRAVLAAALRAALTLAHPVMPFITEAIWGQLAPRLAKLPEVPEVSFADPRKGGLLCTSGWPRLTASAEHPDAEREFDRARTLITAIREVRAAQNVQPKRKVTLHIPAAQTKDWTPHAILIGTLAGIDRTETTPLSAPGVRFAFEGAEYALSNLADAVDTGAEKARLTKLIADKEKSIATMTSRLANPGYAAKAPPAMVKQTQDQLAKDQAELDAARAALAALG
jgi:valyl-tRNA synthetase